MRLQTYTHAQSHRPGGATICRSYKDLFRLGVEPAAHIAVGDFSATASNVSSSLQWKRSIIYYWQCNTIDGAPSRPQSAPSKLELITQNQLALLVRRVFVSP